MRCGLRNVKGSRYKMQVHFIGLKFNILPEYLFHGFWIEGENKCDHLPDGQHCALNRYPPDEAL